MLQKLKILGFKSIKAATLDFGRVNIFIGANGSGKSNLLEAIGLASACLGRGTGDSAFASKGMRITPTELMKSSFKNEKPAKTLELEATFSEGIVYKTFLQRSKKDPLLRISSESASHFGKNLFCRGKPGNKPSSVAHPDRLDEHRGMWDQIKAIHDIPELLADVFEEFSRYAIFLPQTDILRGRRGGSVDSPPIGLHGEGLPDAVENFVKTLDSLNSITRKKTDLEESELAILRGCANLVRIPGWANSFGTRRGNRKLISRDTASGSGKTVYVEDKFMLAARNKLSVYDSSEGTLFLIFAAIILSHPDSPKIFAFDNVDHALNPRMTRTLVEQIIDVVSIAANRKTRIGAKQVFLTSHNPTALDAFDLFDNEHRIFIVGREKNGYTKVTRLEPNPSMSRTDWELAMGSRNLSEIWLDDDIPGALGPEAQGIL